MLGAFGVDFSVPSDYDTYEKDLLKVNRGLLKYGTTSYCPTIVSSSAAVYHKVMRFKAVNNRKKNIIKLPTIEANALHFFCNRFSRT